MAAELPWGSLKFVPVSNIDYTVLPSQFAVKSLLYDLFGLFDRKLQNILDDEHPVRLVFFFDFQSFSLGEVVIDVLLID
uniref:Uncharacterized protein n=1 Tax=Ascaris lumbricoides TaxID=6252 RepID=A0A0M3HEW3_ASCLU